MKKEELKENRKENENYLNGLARAMMHLIIIPCVLIFTAMIFGMKNVGLIPLSYIVVLTVLETIRLYSSDSEDHIIYSYAFFDMVRMLGFALFIGAIIYFFVVIA